MRKRTVRAQREETLARCVAVAAGVGEGAAAALVARGAVYLSGRRCSDPRAKVSAGAMVTVVLEEAGQSTLLEAPPPPELRILHEDEALIAVDKPAGINAQPSPGRVGDSLADLVGAHLGRAAGLVHRLDRETSGVTVFGKSPRATSALAAGFREGGARKRYVAVCGPALPERGTIDLPLSKDPRRPGRFRATRAANGVPAVTGYVRLHACADHALVALFPKTGRTHQLRAHLAALGAPIAGDKRYGGQPEVEGRKAGRCLLHAQALVLAHPLSGEPLLLEAPLPEDLASVFAADGVAPPAGPF